MVVATSQGAQLIPPMMGAAIFMMSDWLGIPYRDLIIQALPLTILFIIGIVFCIYLLSILFVKERGSNPALRVQGYKSSLFDKIDLMSFLIGILSIIIFLIYLRYSAPFSAVWPYS